MGVSNNKGWFHYVDMQFLGRASGRIANLYQISIGQKAKARYNLAQRPL
jgi:hypothetical protein